MSYVVAGAPDLPNNPVIGWRNIVTTSNVEADTEDVDHPASHLANPSTALRWEGVLESPPVEETVTVETNTSDLIDYIAIARHNFATAAIPVTVEGILDPLESPPVWEELVPETQLADDGPAIFRFPEQEVVSIRLRLGPGSAAPRCAVLYVGRLLVLERRLYVGHTPLPYGRETRVTNGRSESGEYLGRVILNEMLETQVSLQNLTPAWYRTHLDPFVEASQQTPFFFAWRPNSYPGEVGFAWITNNPQPSNQRSNGMMQISLSMSGIAP